MKVQVNKQEAAEEIVYPCLMEATGEENEVVLMSSSGAGVLVANPSLGYQMGYYAENWIMENFKPFKGSITLSND